MLLKIDDKDMMQILQESQENLLSEIDSAQTVQERDSMIRARYQNMERQLRAKANKQPLPRMGLIRE